MSINKHKILDISEIISGRGPKNVKNLQDFASQHGKINWLLVKNLINNSINNDFEKYNLDEEKHSLVKLNKNELVYSMYATPGIVAINEFYDNLYINQSFCKIIPNENICLKKFLFYWLIKNKNYALSLSSGTTQSNLNINKIRNFVIYLPPIEEQNAIISIIEPHEKLFIKYSNLVDISSVENTKKDVDNLISIIEPIERIIKNLKTIKYKLETIMNNFFVVFYLFNNEENSNKYKLRNIGKFKGGISTLDKNNYDSGINFINYMDIYKNFVINDDIKLRLYNASEKDIKSYIVSYGDLLLTASSEIKEEIAFSSVYLSNKQAIFNGFSKIYKYDQNILLPIYAAFYFRSEFFRKEVIKLATGYTRFNLSIKDAKNIEISINNFEFQKKFSKIVEPLLNLSTKANKIEKILNDSLLKITKKLIV